MHFLPVTRTKCERGDTAENEAPQHSFNCVVVKLIYLKLECGRCSQEPQIPVVSRNFRRQLTLAGLIFRTIAPQIEELVPTEIEGQVSKRYAMYSNTWQINRMYHMN
jgi:hypothetical protein